MTMASSITPSLFLICLAGYFLLLLLISWQTGKRSNNDHFFLAGRRSPWLVVAIGMIGASLSGVTFISIPGVVGAGGANRDFSYLQIVFGYLLGYLFIANVLLPLYYRLQLTSIYTYLGNRFGPTSYKTGSAFFLLSRSIGASFRLFLVALVLHSFLLGPIGVPFWLTGFGTIALIWVYTYRGGLNTIVWTDTLQTISMLGAAIWTIIYIVQTLGGDWGQIWNTISEAGYNQVLFFEGGWSDPNNFFKQFFSGALITIVMTGLDQDMMQKNLSCKTLKDAQKNMYSFSAVLVVANLIFLTLGALLYVYIAENGIPVPERSDQLFPMLALNYFPTALGIVFLIGLLAAAYSSADSALTALTTSFCIDFMGFEKEVQDTDYQKRVRFWVHLAFSGLLLIIILIFWAIENEAVINSLFRAAGYTYGPLLGLFSFGLLTRIAVKDRWVWVVCLISPLLSFVLDYFSVNLFGGFQFGFLTLALNGLLTFLGLWILSIPDAPAGQSGKSTDERSAGLL